MSGLQITPYNPQSPLSALTGALIAQNTGLNIVKASFIGISGQAGTFSGFNLQDARNALTLPDGVLLTNGLALNALGPNNSTGTSADDFEPGDPRLDALANSPTFDANELTIQFTTQPGVKSVLFDFVFGSEEFPEFVGAFNDAFGAFLDGKQISFDQAGKPVTVNNNFFQLDNNTAPFNFDSSYGSITADKTHVNFDIQYDGLTPRLTTQAALDPSLTTHTITFAIADAGDHALDSGVFLAQFRGSTLTVGDAHTDLSSNVSEVPTHTPTPTPAPQPASQPTTTVDQNVAVAVGQADEQAQAQQQQQQSQRRRDAQLLPILLDSVAKTDTGAGFFVAPQGSTHRPLPGDFAFMISADPAQPLGSVSGKVFEDYNGDGLQATNEPGLANQIVYIDLNGNGILDENDLWTRTNEKGEYRIQGLTPGVYHVRQALWTSILPTRPTNGERMITISMQRNVVTDQDFGAIQRNARSTEVVSSPSEVETLLRPQLVEETVLLKNGQSLGDKLGPAVPSAPVASPQQVNVPAASPTEKRDGEKQSRKTPEKSSSRFGAWAWIMAATSGLAALGVQHANSSRKERPELARAAAGRDGGAC
jgi:hypothetical protein